MSRNSGPAAASRMIGTSTSVHRVRRHDSANIAMSTSVTVTRLPTAVDRMSVNASRTPDNSVLSRLTSAPVRALVARAKARGEWRAGVQGEQLMFLLVGALIHRALLEHEELSARWLTALVDLVLHGVTPRGP